MDILFQTILTLTSLLIFILLSAIVLEEVLPKWGRIKADRLWNALLLGIFFRHDISSSVLPSVRLEL